MKVSEMKKKLRKAGCYKIREGTRHEIWYSPKTDEEFPVSRHNTEELPTGTANSIKKAAGLK